MKLLSISLLLVAIALYGIGREIARLRYTLENVEAVQITSIQHRLDNHNRVLTGMADRIKADENYMDETADQVSAIRGRTPQQFVRRYRK
jgi:hypothetical protein